MEVTFSPSFRAKPFVAVSGRIDRFVRVPGFPLRQLMGEQLDPLRILFLLQLGFQIPDLVADRIVQFAVAIALLATGQVLGPAVLAGQVTTMPLGLDVVQLPQHAPANQIHGVVVEHAVVALMTGGQQQILLRPPRGPSLCTAPRCGPSASRSAHACL